MSDANPVSFYGVLVTYQRPDALSRSLARLAAQTRQLDVLVVVDNGGEAAAERVVAGHPGGYARYIDAGANLGPAGGFALGMETLLADADDGDWVFLFDDDDPPFFDDAIERAAEFAQRMVATDPHTGGVGISGGRFDQRRGRVVRIGDAEIHGSVTVDHITGGGLPAYRVGAIRQIGVFDSQLFFGFEELEFGLRMSRGGFHIYADGEQWKLRKAVKRDEGLLPPEEVSVERASKAARRARPVTWRRYYSLRNLIFILRRLGSGRAAVRVALLRGVLKPAANLPFAPKVAWHSLLLNWRAIRDAWAGRMGLTVVPGSLVGEQPDKT